MSDKRVCNYCGKELDLFDLQEDFSIHRQHIGYGSIHDGDNVDLQLCCDCFDKLVSECNVSPIEEQSSTMLWRRLFRKQREYEPIRVEDAKLR
mgnify:CR=1 FL=1